MCLYNIDVTGSSKKDVVRTLVNKHINVVAWRID